MLIPYIISYFFQSKQISHSSSYDKSLIRDRLGHARTHVIDDDDLSLVKHSSTRAKPRPPEPTDPAVLLKKKSSKEKIDKVHTISSTYINSHNCLQ